MSNRASDLNIWIIQECDANISVPVYSGIAPEGTCHPFITFSIISDTPYRSTCGDKGTYSIQFSVFDDIQKLSRVNELVDELRDYFDDRQDVAESIELMEYSNTSIINQAEEQGWQGILDYTVYMT